MKRGYIADFIDFLSDNEEQLVYTIPFFLLMGLGSIRFSVLRPIVTAAFFVLPLHLMVRLATDFDEQDYHRFSPVLQNIDSLRFSLVCLLFLSVPVVSWYLEVGLGWQRYGTIGLFMTVSSIIVFIWSESVYVKNFYFNRWHLVERGLLIFSGALVILFGPVFVPLFLLAHKVITRQFNFPDIGGFMGAHSRLPWTILLIASSFAVVRLFLPIQPSQVIFLLLCGYSAHYFHPGLAKVANNGPLYYLQNSNPFYMFLNAYVVGWMDFLDEEWVLQAGNYTDKIKLAVNISVILIEMGSILVIFTYPVSIIALSLTLILQLLILATTGVNFWKWIIIEAAAIIGLIVSGPQTFAYFGNPYWFVLFGVFVVFAHAWMNPVGMDWLDSTYTEFYKFVGETSDGNEFNLHPNIFRPFDPMVAQGAQGSFIFLGGDPTITYCLGGINTESTKDIHKKIASSLNKSKSEICNTTQLVEVIGENTQNEDQSKALEEILTQFLKSDDSVNSALRLLSSPREFYTNGISDRDSAKIQSDLTCIHVYRIDGVWSADGFNKLACKEVLSAQLDKGI